MLNFVLFIVLLIGSTFGSAISSDDDPLHNYILNIQSKLDTDINPCQDFGKYACGKLNLKEIYDDKPVKLYDDYFRNNPPKTNMEIQLYNYLNSYKNRKNLKQVFDEVEHFKSVGQWPISKPFNKTELAQYLGRVIYSESIISMDFDSLEKLNIKENILIDENIIYMHDIEKIMKHLEIPADKWNDISTPIKTLANSLADVSSQQIEYTEILFDDLKDKIKIFDWDIFIDGAAEFLGIKNAELKNKTFSVTSGAVEVLKLMVNADDMLVSNLVIYNSLIAFEEAYSFSNIFTESMINKLYPYFIKNIIDYYTSHTDLTFQLQILQNFQNNYYETLKFLKLKKHEAIETDILPRIKILGNLNTEQNNTIKIPELDLSSEHFYLNFFKIYKLLIASRLEGTIDLDLLDTVYYELLLKDIILFGSKKPIIHYYSTFNHKAWEIAYSFNSRITSKCFLEGIPESRGYTNHLAFNDYLNDGLSSLQSSTTQNLGLTDFQAFALATAQNYCILQKSYDSNPYLINYLKYHNRFSKDFKCTENELMYSKTCEETFERDGSI